LKIHHLATLRATGATETRFFGRKKLHSFDGRKKNHSKQKNTLRRRNAAEWLKQSDAPVAEAKRIPDAIERVAGANCANMSHLLPRNYAPLRFSQIGGRHCFRLKLTFFSLSPRVNFFPTGFCCYSRT
jgi:hypothetical protein